MKLYDSLLPVSLVSRLSSSVLVILHRSSEAHLILFNIAFITLFWLFLSLFFLSQLCVPELVALITLWIPIGEFRRPTVTCSCVSQILAAGKLGIVWLPCGNCEGLQNIQFFFFWFRGSNTDKFKPHYLMKRLPMPYPPQLCWKRRVCLFGRTDVRLSGPYSNRPSPVVKHTDWKNSTAAI